MMVNYSFLSFNLSWKEVLSSQSSSYHIIGEANTKTQISSITTHSKEHNSLINDVPFVRGCYWNSLVKYVLKGKKITMLPGWPQCTSQSGRFQDLTSSTKGPNRDLTVAAEFRQQISNIIRTEGNEVWWMINRPENVIPT